MTKPLQDLPHSPVAWYDGILEWFFINAAGGTIPAAWFEKRVPAVADRASKTGRLSLELVSHCWQYSNLLAYQLSSLVNYPPSKLNLTVTLFYSPEDSGTQQLVEFFDRQQVSNVTWNWQPVKKQQLFRRGIGRNAAAKRSTADWLWFTDCDIIFHQGCFDTLAEQLQGRTDSLLYPRTERTTPMLPQDDPMLQPQAEPQLVDIPHEQFTEHSRDRAKGAFQITHGDVARAIGYCESIPIYQTPAEHWCKCREDRAFRWLLGTQGIPIDVPGVYQIRHIHKGRYKANSWLSRLRSKIRRVQE